MSGVATAIVGSSLLSSYSANKAAKTAAQSNIEAAQIGAEAAKFKPYNITTALGSASFTGNTANLAYNPALAAYRDRLFALGASTLPSDIAAEEEAAYQRLKAGGQSALEQSIGQLGTGLFRTGRAGLDIYGSQPELRAFSSSMLDRENQLREAARAQVAAKIGQSTGLTTAGFGTETALMQPLEIGAGLGGRAVVGNVAGGQLLAQAGQSAAQTMYGARLAGIAGMQSTATSPLMTDFIKSLFNQGTPSYASAPGYMAAPTAMQMSEWYGQTPTNYINP